jgi:serine/threonine-protein kinase
MDERSHHEAVNDDELLFDRDETMMGASHLELDDPLPRARLVPPPPPRQTPFAAAQSTRSNGSYSQSRPPTSSLRELNPFRPGDVLAGRYLVERIAGRTGLGLLVHVRHVDLGQRLLLKCLPPDACHYPDSVDRFLRGARAAMRLQGEHTARTIDAGRLSSGAPYVVAESLTGCDLREVLRVRGAVTLSEAVDFVLQAAEALAEAHSYGLVHRNINLFTLFATRRPDGSSLIKVLDFGVAEALRVDPLRSHEVALDAYTVSGGSNPIVQALAYCSPEQLRNPTELDPRTDVWALGAVLHELLAGQPVYQAETIPALWASIAADPPMPITSVRGDVPAGLESVILRCLSKDRSARFATVAELAVALKKFASPEAQLAVDRITRTLGRATQPPPLPAHSAALVHIGPAAHSAPAAAPAAMTPPFPLLWSTVLVAFGLVGGTLAGVLVATRGIQESRAQASPAVEQRVLAALPAPSPATPPAPVAQAAPTPPATPAPAAAPPVAAPVKPATVAASPAAAVAPAAPVAPVAQVAQAPRAPVRRPKAAATEAPRADGPETEAAAGAAEVKANPEKALDPAPDGSAPAKLGGETARAAVATGKDLFDSMR